jgi:hypothetical protein
MGNIVILQEGFMNVGWMENSGRQDEKMIERSQKLMNSYEMISNEKPNK